VNRYKREGLRNATNIQAIKYCIRILARLQPDFSLRTSVCFEVLSKGGNKENQLRYVSVCICICICMYMYMYMYVYVYVYVYVYAVINLLKPSGNFTYRQV
jgi:hypothetical protein